MWDQLKEVGGMDVRRLTNLARLFATLLAAGSLPPTALKVRRLAWLGCCWGACRRHAARMQAADTPLPPALPASHTVSQTVDFGAAMAARELLFWRVCFEHLLAACKTPADSNAIFQR